MTKLSRIDAFEKASYQYNAALTKLETPEKDWLPLRDSVGPALNDVNKAISLLTPHAKDSTAAASIECANDAVKLLGKYLAKDPLHDFADIKVLEQARTNIRVADATLSYGP